MAHTHNTSSVLRKKTVQGLAATALVAMSLAPGLAQAEDAGGYPSKPVCIEVNRVDHTEVLNDRQILFHLLGGKTLVNTMTTPCSTLTRWEGFVWVGQLSKYCDNLESIRVIRTGQVCLLGAFTPYAAPKGS